MKMLRWTMLAAALMGGAVAAAGAPSGADPAKGDVFLLDCPSGDVLVSVNGNGAFTPGHVVGSTVMVIPTAFDLTFTGPEGTEHETSAHAHPAKTGETCALNISDGEFSASGTVDVFFTPQGS